MCRCPKSGSSLVVVTGVRRSPLMAVWVHREGQSEGMLVAGQALDQQGSQAGTGRAVMELGTSIPPA